MGDIVDAQQQCWDRTFAERPDMFGAVASDPAQKALELLKLEGKTNLLEPGAAAVSG